MTYEQPGCAYCPGSVEACRAGEMAERGPGFCPTKVDPDGIVHFVFRELRVASQPPGPRVRIEDGSVQRTSRVDAFAPAQSSYQWDTRPPRGCCI